MDQTKIAYKALGAAWDQVAALMLNGRISAREAERIKAELDRAGDAIAPGVLEVLAMEFRSSPPNEAYAPKGLFPNGPACR